jgi:hypothetical protein
MYRSKQGFKWRFSSNYADILVYLQMLIDIIDYYKQSSYSVSSSVFFLSTYFRTIRISSFLRRGFRGGILFHQNHLFCFGIIIGNKPVKIYSACKFLGSCIKLHVIRPGRFFFVYKSHNFAAKNVEYFQRNF